jgi:thermitase
MRLLCNCLVLGLILSLVAFTGPALAVVAKPLAGAGDGACAPDRVLVKFKDGVDKAAKGRVHAKHGGRVVGEIPALGVQVVAVPTGSVDEKVKDYKAESAVDYAEPDYVATAVGIPNDPYFSQQWALNNVGQTGGTPDADIDAPEAWDVVPGSPVVKIAILDTGIDQDHEELAAKIVANANFSASTTVDDLFGHGTHCAGIATAAADNGLGVAGVAYGCGLMNVKVLDDTGNGYYSGIAAGIVWAADNGAKVISMSFGGTLPSLTLRNAVNYAWAKGAVLVAAAGNNNTAKPLYPAYYANCIAVAATDANDQKASFSNYGKWVDVAAPGVDILSTLPNHASAIGGYFGVTNYGLLSGTSMATPHVAGIAGLVWATGYGTSNLAVRARVERTADKIPGTGLYWAYGRVNAARAVR